MKESARKYAQSRIIIKEDMNTKGIFINMQFPHRTIIPKKFQKSRLAKTLADRYRSEKLPVFDGQPTTHKEYLNTPGNRVLHAYHEARMYEDVKQTSLFYLEEESVG